jgi:hypothetical protein
MEKKANSNTLLKTVVISASELPGNLLHNGELSHECCSIGIASKIMTIGNVLTNTTRRFAQSLR